MSIDQHSTVHAENQESPGKLVAAEGEPKIEYFAAFNYVFAHPDWFNSLLMGFVCMLIPILSQILLLGYRYEIVEMKLRFPNQLYPKFDFSRFSQYLTRGIWPFLIDFVMQFILTVPILIVFYGSLAVVGLAVAGNEQTGVIVAAVVVPLVIIFLIAVSLFLATAMVPLYLRAGLTQDIGLALNFGWIKDFLSKVGFQTLLFNLFLMVSGALLGIVGYLACCFGLVVVIFLLGGPVVAHAHWQLYRLYLARGGEPIPLKPLQLPLEYSPAPAGYAPPGKPLA